MVPLANFLLQSHMRGKRLKLKVSEGSPALEPDGDVRP